MTAQRPLLLLDVDGVLNPFVPIGDPVPDGFEEHRIDGIRVLLAPRHGEWLQSLMPAYDLVWATTWEADANERIGSVLGLPPIPHITFTPAPPGYEGWTKKLPDVITFVGDRPLAWLDDRFGADEHEWAAERTKAGIPTLLLATDGRIGLTSAKVRQLQAFGERPFLPL